MRNLLAALFLAVFTFPSYATDRCVPLPELDAQAEAISGQIIRIYEGVDVSKGFIAAYTSALRLPPPPDSSPVGLMFVSLGDKTWLGLIEKGSCVVYSKVIPTSVHESALNMAAAGI